MRCVKYVSAIALVLQDGIEDLPIPWPIIDAVFVGGSDKFKDSKASEDCARCAKVIGKWVHVGRVNAGGRFQRWEEIGADSCDGRGVSMYSKMRKSIMSDPHPLLTGS